VKKIFLTIVLFHILSQSAWSANFEEDKYAWDSIVRISHETLNSEHDKAISETQELIGLYPREPFPRFLLTTIYMYILRSYSNFPADEKYENCKKSFWEQQRMRRKPVMNIQFKMPQSISCGEWSSE
jgi:hypothetical protein